MWDYTHNYYKIHDSTRYFSNNFSTLNHLNYCNIAEKNKK